MDCPLRRRFIAKHALQRSRSYFKKMKRLKRCAHSYFYLLIRSILYNRHVRKRREGRAESLTHLLRWSFQKRDTHVAQPLRMNKLPRNFCETSRFWKRNPTVATPLQVWQERSAALSSLPLPLCMHNQVILEGRSSHFPTFAI